MRRLRHTAVVLLVALSLVGEPVSAAPIDVTTDERLAKSAPATATLTGIVLDLSTIPTSATAVLDSATITDRDLPDLDDAF